MRLVTFQFAGHERLGALQSGPSGEMVVDLQRSEPRLPANMLDFLRAGAEARALAEAVLSAAPAADAATFTTAASAHVTSAAARLPLSQVTLSAPVPVPGKILCIGRNYADHAAEGNAPVPTSPVVFAKYSNVVIGPGEAIVLPRISQQVDYEGELAVVIGRRTRHVTEAEALQYVAGYTVFNDVSARDLQFLTSQWTLGKSPDTFGPMGPALVTADEIPDPQTLSVQTSIGGEMLQNGNTRDMIFPIAYLVSYLSHILTLEPGDVIATGTPSGVGHYRKPPRFLTPGEVVRIEVERVGVLDNPVTAET
jgi:acylpyruvate hydrolase